MKTVDVIYLVYVYIPDNLYKKIEGLNYIYNHFEYKADTSIWSGLYGFSFSKKKVKKFMEIHNKKYFKVVKVDDSDPKFNKLYAELKSNKNKILEIGMYPFFTEGRKNVKFATTKFEKITSSQTDIDDSSYVIFKDIFENRKIIENLPEPVVFNKEIYTSLVKLGYEYMYYNLFNQFTSSEDDDDDESLAGSSNFDIFQYNLGFGISAFYGVQFKMPDQDELRVFILLFGKLLGGETINNEKSDD